MLHALTTPMCLTVAFARLTTVMFVSRESTGGARRPSSFVPQMQGRMPAAYPASFSGSSPVP